MKSSNRFVTAWSASAAALLLAALPLLAAEESKSDKKAASQLKVAQSFYDTGRYGEALGAVEQMLKEDRRYVPARRLRGQILVSMDALDEALEEFDRTLKLEPGYTEVRNWKGYTLVHLGRYDEAMREFQKALEDRTFPSPEVIHLNIGKLHRLQGRTDAAIASMKKAVELNPSFARGYFELGMTYEQLGRNEESLKSYTDALVGMEESPDLNLRLGIALLRTGNAPKAREHFEKVIRLAPDGPEATRARDEIRKLQSPS
ncbi:MAG TPA: tetratricopeptide repeat protein [Candidatus Polarisedimenticolia bacterium]|jgi:Tfp pilus assembly protein PilF